MLASWVSRWCYRRFQRACASPLEAQAKRLRIILRRAAATDFGRAHDFAALARVPGPAALVRAFQDRVPIRSYREMQPELEAVERGEWQRLCPSRPIFFSMTAGSTGAYKRIPITREFRREVGMGSLIVQGALEDCFPELRRLRLQFLVGSAEGGVTEGGVPQGFSSGFNYKHLPRMVRHRFVLPYWVFTLHDVDDRSYAAGRLLVAERQLGALCAISPVNLINVRQSLETHAERLCTDIAMGTLTLRGTSAVPGMYRGTPDPALAAALRQARARGGRFPTELLFPALRVLVCWQGGNMGYYLHELAEQFGGQDRFEFPVSASEGLFAIPCQGNRAGGALAVTTHFLEFLPASGGTHALRADELSVGALYRLVITTSGGLYRYDMEDLVRVTGMSACTPIVEFVSKADRQTSVSNERLTEGDVTVAMEAASRASDVWVDRFLFVPCSDRRYRVLVDGAAVGRLLPPERDARLGGLADALERALRTASKGYDFEREDALLEPLHLVVTAPGALAASEARPQALPNAQVKPRHLTPVFDAHATLALEGSHAARGA